MCNSGSGRLSSLALDSSRGLLYFTDPGRGIVGELSTDGSSGSPHLLIFSSNDNPKAIAVDSINRHFMHISSAVFY